MREREKTGKDIGWINARDDRIKTNGRQLPCAPVLGPAWKPCIPSCASHGSVLGAGMKSVECDRVLLLPCCFLQLSCSFPAASLQLPRSLPAAPCSFSVAPCCFPAASLRLLAASMWLPAASLQLSCSSLLLPCCYLQLTCCPSIPPPLALQ